MLATKSGPRDPRAIKVVASAAITTLVMIHRAACGELVPSLGEATTRKVTRPATATTTETASRARHGVAYQNHRIATTASSSLTIRGCTTATDPRCSAIDWIK